MKKHFVTVLLAIVPIGFLCALVFAPMLALLRLDDAAPMWAQVWQETFYRERIVWTVFQAALTVFLTILLGVPIAWVLARLDFVGRRWILRLLMLPFIMPTLVAGMGVLALFGERGILWRGWADTAVLLLYGNVFFNLPVMTRAAYQGFCAVPSNRLAAVQTLGANVWQRFVWVELPVIKNWLLGAACLIFLYCFSGFGLALLLGGQQYATIEVAIYQLIAYELDMAHAAVLVWLVLAITAMAGGAAAWFARQTNAQDVQLSLPKLPECLWEYIAIACTLFVLLLCCALPLLAVAAKVLMAGEAWQVLWESDTLSALYNTARFSASAVALAVVLGLLHAALARRLGVVRGLTFLPFMISPVCLSFGVLLLYSQAVSHTAFLISLYALLAYPFVTKDILTAWDALPPQYQHAARVFGATPWQAFWVVTLPLLLPALRRGMTLAAATCIGEFAASLFLSRPEWTTLTTLIYRYLGKVGAENHDKAMVLTLCLMLLSCAAFILLDSQNHPKKDK